MTTIHTHVTFIYSGKYSFANVLLCIQVGMQLVTWQQFTTTIGWGKYSFLSLVDMDDTLQLQTTNKANLQLYIFLWLVADT